MINTVDTATAGTLWEYLEGVQSVVLVTRENGQPRAIIELCPREGFRLTDCSSGGAQTFISLDDAKQEYERRPGSAKPE